MTKSKKKTTANGIDYPQEHNPFGSTEKLAKKSKKGKIKVSGKKEKEQTEDYPKESNPFLAEKSKKELKKEEKKEKKALKKEAKREKKEMKRMSKGELPDANGNKIGKSKIKEQNVPIIVKPEIVTPNDTANARYQRNGKHAAGPLLQTPTGQQQCTTPNAAKLSPIRVQLSQTLDNRSPIRDFPDGGTLPIAPPKRVQQLKIGRQGSVRNPNLRSSLPDLTQQDQGHLHVPSHLAKPKSMVNLDDDSQATNKPSYDVTHRSRDVTCQPYQPRPQSLDFRGGYHYTNTLLSPVKEERGPSVTQDTINDVKMYRTSSVSKKGKEKKRMRKLAKRLKRKKKSKGKQDSIMADQEVANQVVMRKPKVNIENLRREVKEVEESVRSSIISLAEQRNSALDRLTEKTAEMEKFAEGFAQSTHQVRLRNQARLTCCGLAARWKVCWYICACEGKLKTKKRRQKDMEMKGKDGSPEARDLLDDDDDDYYQPVNVNSNTKVVAADVTAGQATSSGRNLSTAESLDGDTRKPSPPTIRNRFLNLPAKLRCSMPVLSDMPTDSSSSLRRMAEIDPRERKSSSVNALHEIVKKHGEKRRRARQERDISKFASQYDDEETRRKVEELLRLDM